MCSKRSHAQKSSMRRGNVHIARVSETFNAKEKNELKIQPFHEVAVIAGVGQTFHNIGTHWYLRDLANRIL